MDDFIINPDTDGNWGKDHSKIEINIRFWESGRAVFNNCFKNPFVYQTYLFTLPESYRRQIMEPYYIAMETDGGCFDKNAMDQEIDEYNRKEWLLKNQALYKYLNDNLNVGEFIEIYTAWIRDDVCYGPPTFKTIVNLEDVLNLPISKSTNVFKYDESEKLTIYKRI